jgi:hypothetical protein
MHTDDSQCLLSGCWLSVAQVTYAAVRLDNKHCESSKRSLQFVQFLASSADNTANGEVMVALGGQWPPAHVRAAVITKLKSATCNGDTLLVTLPVPFKISEQVYNMAQGVTVTGMVFSALAIVFVWVWRARTSVRSSSPVFLLAMCVGLIIMFYGAGRLAEPDPDSASCNASFWLINLGWCAALRCCASPLLASVAHSHAVAVLRADASQVPGVRAAVRQVVARVQDLHAHADESDSHQRRQPARARVRRRRH